MAAPAWTVAARHASRGQAAGSECACRSAVALASDDTRNQAGAFWPCALPAGAARPLARQLRVFSASQEPGMAGRAPDTPQLPPPTAADLLRDSRLAALSGA